MCGFGGIGGLGGTGRGNMPVPPHLEHVLRKPYQLRPCVPLPPHLTHHIMPGRRTLPGGGGGGGGAA